MSNGLHLTVAKNVAHGAMVLALLFQSPGLTPIAHSVPPPIMDQNHVIVDEVLTLVQTYFIDPGFHGVDWDRVRDALMSKPLRSKSETYITLRKALGELGDKYTRVLTPQDMQKLRKYDVSGVGLLLTANAKGELVVASDPLPSSPAGQAGVKQGSIVVSIDDKYLAGIPAFEASQLMQGADGSLMKVGVKEVNSKNERVVSLKRTYTEGGGAPVVSSLNEWNGRYVGYIRLQDFSARSRGDMETSLRDLDNRGANAYILDLRQNPGGVFEGALEIAGLMEGRDAVVAKVANRNGAEDIFRSRLVEEKNNNAVSASTSNSSTNSRKSAIEVSQKYKNGSVISPDAPLAILIDDGSASASEVLGGSLRDNCRGAVVGTTHSFGKGLIQGVFGLSDGGGVIVTVASYKTPSGVEIQGKGLIPEIRLSDGVLQQIVRFARGQGLEADIDFDKVEEKLQLCRDNANSNRLVPSESFMWEKI